MARKRTVTSDTTTTEPDVFDEQIAARAAQAGAIVESVATATEMPPEKPVTGYVANPSSTPRTNHAEHVRGSRFPGKYGVSAGESTVRLIDKGDNKAGIGIRVEFPEDRLPNPEELAIIRKHLRSNDGQNEGFEWKRDMEMWHKHILREGESIEDVPPSRAVAIRLDAESRVRSLAEELKQHSTDPVGYAEKIRAERVQPAEHSVF